MEDSVWRMDLRQKSKDKRLITLSQRVHSSTRRPVFKLHYVVRFIPFRHTSHPSSNAPPKYPAQ